ncbi:MAG TPA: nucleotidyltransferase family protein [Acidobacteriaceae bacterium]|nr:nucleotidyltransferase family protein [Acidobacteriaceae bacterium]
MTVAAVVLAAGASRRLGRAKQLVEIGGETLLERAVRVAVEARLAPVIVVVRDASVAGGLRGCEVVVRDPGVASILGGVEVVVNALADEGMASSIRAGVSRARELGVVGVVVMACDQVALRAEHLRSLCGEVDRVTGSGYAGKVGIPAYFPAEKFSELMELRGDVGARGLLRGAVVVVDESLGLDVDTETDVERARGMLG